MNQYAIISKYGERTRQLKSFKKELKNFHSRNNGSRRKSLRTGVEWKEVIELLENATPGSLKKDTKYGVKIFQGKNLETFFFSQFKHPS